jgi:hypothetical protein
MRFIRCYHFGSRRRRRGAWRRQHEVRFGRYSTSVRRAGHAGGGTERGQRGHSCARRGRHARQPRPVAPRGRRHAGQPRSIAPRRSGAQCRRQCTSWPRPKGRDGLRLPQASYLTISRAEAGHFPRLWAAAGLHEGAVIRWRCGQVRRTGLLQRFRRGQTSSVGEVHHDVRRRRRPEHAQPAAAAAAATAAARGVRCGRVRSVHYVAVAVVCGERRVQAPAAIRRRWATGTAGELAAGDDVGPAQGRRAAGSLAGWRASSPARGYVVGSGDVGFGSSWRRTHAGLAGWLAHQAPFCRAAQRLVRDVR